MSAIGHPCSVIAALLRSSRPPDHMLLAKEWNWSIWRKSAYRFFTRCAKTIALEFVREKWEPVFQIKTNENKEIESLAGSM
ncbi:hypothetical protein NAC44_07635 [Allorhizobium sp. BGMRC 0089]|uniref:hypothetical protein n=1 Tax=Allorhizobium sonneratiae TaxID=2934936 RepID=UPI002033EA67|nr:hypothetical protein [Allorhizobium sonneratiae]MCM2292197.1 hypothetical protein [Allorhizobium sonneratiae]